MTGPTVLDHVLLLGFAVAYPLYGYLTWPRFVAHARAARPGARVRTYCETIVAEWALAVALLVHWAASERPWSLLGLGDLRGGHGPLAMTAVISLATLAFLHARGVARAPAEQLAGARGQLGELVHLMPHTAIERGWFAGLSLTAGACEELFFRGLAPWLLSSWMPAWAAMASATALFGLAHAYQGLAGIPRTAIIGAALALLTLWAGTLWPAILLHTVIDLHGGSVGGSIARAPAAAQT